MSPTYYTDNQQQLDVLTSISRIAANDEHTENNSKRLFPIILLAVFFITLLFALTSGVAIYKHTTSVQNETSAQREGLQLISNIVRANDSTGSVAVGSGPEGRSLVIVENLNSGKYETRVYLYEGKILQEYSVASSPYTPTKASVLAESDSFDFSYVNGLLTIKTDQGTVETALRYLQGGE